MSPTPAAWTKALELGKLRFKFGLPLLHPPACPARH